VSSVQAGKTYGLNFASQSDADTFERGITAAVNKLKQGASSGGAGAMAGLNLMSRESANNGQRPAAQRSSVGQGAQMRGGAQMMMTMPKDMGAAFDQQREADIAAFRQMSAARKSAPAPARAPPSPQLSPHSSGPPPVPTASKKSQLSEDTSYGNDNGYNGGGGDDSYGGGGDTSNDYGGGDDGDGGGGDGDEEFTDAEIEAWRDSVIEAVRAEIEMVKQELVEAVQQYYGGGGGGGGGGDWNGGGGGW
jgi:hypothetical protein